jgi:hypothetical protein
MSAKEQLLIDWIAQNKLKTEGDCLDFRLKYGKYAGFSLAEMLGDNDRIQHIKWLKQTTRSQNLKKIISAASRAMLRELNAL